MDLPSEVMIQDDFLPQQDSDSLIEWFRDKCRWEYYNGVVGDQYNEHPDDFQFVYSIYRRNEGFIAEYPSECDKLFDIISPFMWLRIKANFRLKTDEVRMSVLHNDYDVPGFYTSIYYVNSNDGGTTFENGSRVESKQNRLITFPCQLKHAGSTSSDTKERFVINLNYMPKKFGFPYLEQMQIVKNML